MEIRGWWIDLVHRDATGTKKARTLLTPVGVLVFTAFTGLFVVAAFLVDRLSLVTIFTPRYILANVWEIEAIEEPEPVRRFGDAYEDNRRRTPMFIPRLRRTSE